jgi:voltage-gated potassium channel
VWEQLPSGRVTHRFEWVVIAATLAVIPVLIIESDASPDSPWRDVAYAANWLIWLIFFAELAFIFIVAPRKRAALRAHWLDELIVLLTVPAFGSFLASLRLLRLARLLRFLRLGALLTRALQRERALTSGETFRFVALLTMLVVVLGGAAEATVDSGDFSSIWSGIWWAVVTVTTVGYGDITPKSTEGRLIAIPVMFVGIGFLSVLTATIASRFVKTERSSESHEILEALARIEQEIAELKGR